MELKLRATRTMPSVIAYLFAILAMTGPIVGNVLNWRQESNTDKSTVIAVTASPGSSTAAASASTTNPASGAESESHVRPVLASPTSGSTEGIPTASTTAASAQNSTVPDNSPLNETNDPSFCHRIDIPGVEKNPFCTPEQGSYLDVNASYEVTWDATLFPFNEEITLTLHSLNESAAEVNTPSEAALSSQTVNSALGVTFINTTSAMLEGKSNATLFLFAIGSENGQPTQYPGPLFYLRNQTNSADNSTHGASSSSSSSNSKALGEKVGIPIGLILFLIILAALAFFLFRRRRASNAGYATGKSHRQRTNTGSLRNGGGAAGIGGRGHKRQESFHDEPTSGGGGSVELQDRNRGLTGEDSWDWGRESVGSPVSSVVSPTGNQFRDELQRQRTGGTGGRR